MPNAEAMKTTTASSVNPGFDLKPAGINPRFD
jgi:hypothetical protein